MKTQNQAVKYILSITQVNQGWSMEQTLILNSAPPIVELIFPRLLRVFTNPGIFHH